jgi:Zn-dependent peptidase ImmA (M78 family)/transcriptional regulator with XRE-family HTH domain
MTPRQPIIRIEPSILIWARKSLGLSISEVAAKLDKDSQLVRQWELGKQQPSYAQLEKLAYSIYKRPLAVFFLPKPPTESTPRQDFRTLPEKDISKLSKPLRLLVRKAKHHQLVLKEIHDNKNPVQNPVHKEFKFRVSSNPSDTARKLRSYFNITAQLQKSFKNSEVAFKHYRDTVEKSGIYVFQYPLLDARGFSLMDKEFPVIVLNSSDTWNGRIFTLFHELCHILFNTGGVFIDLYTQELRKGLNQVEIFCNQFASEFLLPEEVLLNDPLILEHESKEWSEATIRELSAAYKVSKEVVLRKLLDSKRTSPGFYRAMRSKWLADYQKGKEKRKKEGGGSYHITNLSHLGKNYVSGVLASLYNGKLTETQVADILEIKINKIKDYEKRVF